MPIGRSIGRMGMVARRAEENELLGQQQAANEYLMADNLRRIRNEQADRTAAGAGFRPMPSPLTKMTPSEVNRSGNVPVQGTKAQLPPMVNAVPGQLVGLSKARGTYAGADPNTTIPTGPGKDISVGQIPGVELPPIPPRFAKQQQGSNIMNIPNAPNDLGQGQFPSPTMPWNEPAANNLDLTSSQGTPILETGTTIQPGSVVGPGVGQRMIGGSPATGGGGGSYAGGNPNAIPAQYSGQDITAETAGTRHRIAQIDQMMEHLTAKYQQLLPHRNSPVAAEQLGKLELQIQTLGITRSQTILNDALNEAASTGTMDRVVAVMNGMGYKIGFKDVGGGKFVRIGPDGRVTSKPAQAHVIAGNLRVAFNAELQQKMREMQMEYRLQELQGRQKLEQIHAKGPYDYATAHDARKGAATVSHASDATEVEMMMPDGEGGVSLQKVYKDSDGNYQYTNTPPSTRNPDGTLRHWETEMRTIPNNPHRQSGMLPPMTMGGNAGAPLTSRSFNWNMNSTRAQ